MLRYIKVTAVGIYDYTVGTYSGVYEVKLRVNVNNKYKDFIQMQWVAILSQRTIPINALSSKF